eukprot:750035-Hanusia_phi.AAC.3
MARISCLFPNFSHPSTARLISSSCTDHPASLAAYRQNNGIFATGFHDFCLTKSDEANLNLYIAIS